MTERDGAEQTPRMGPSNVERVVIAGRDPLRGVLACGFTDRVEVVEERWLCGALGRAKCLVVCPSTVMEALEWVRSARLGPARFRGPILVLSDDADFELVDDLFALNAVVMPRRGMVPARLAERVNGLVRHESGEQQSVIARAVESVRSVHPSLQESLEITRLAAIEAALREHHSERAAARALGMHRRSLQYSLAKGRK